MSDDATRMVQRIQRLKSDLIDQGRRVQALVEGAFESLFAGDEAKARRTIDADDAIDRVDVQIEKAAVGMLVDIAHNALNLSEHDVRLVLTIVKVNNELERIADLGVGVAEHVAQFSANGAPMPATFTVMANSVVGIIRDSVRALDKEDADLARLTLRSDDTVTAFAVQVIREVEAQIAAGAVKLDDAFRMHALASRSEWMVDHASNICEQVIYSARGKIVRHLGGHWEDAPNQPS